MINEHTTQPSTTSRPSSYGIFITGGETNQTVKAAGLYNPTTGAYCNLPPLDPPRRGHSMTGLMACGGSYSDFDRSSCFTFNVSSGTWYNSYNYSGNRYSPVGWKNEQGVLLIGGIKDVDTTTLLYPNGTSQPGFNLNRTFAASWLSCGIEDHHSGTIIITGGRSTCSTSTSSSCTASNRVNRLGETGYIESLPNMAYKREFHGCGGYYNDDQTLVYYIYFHIVKIIILFKVILVFGGKVGLNDMLPTEKLTVGQKWETIPAAVSNPVKGYVWSVSLNNDIFMQGANIEN